MVVFTIVHTSMYFGFLQLHRTVRSAADELSWVENLYPTRLAERMSQGLKSISDWFKSSGEENSTSSSAQEGSSTRTSRLGNHYG